MLKDFVGNKRNETNVFQLCCVQRAYVGYVGWKTLKVTLKWLQGCQKNEQKMKIFCKSNKRSYGVYEHIKNGQNAMLNFPTD